jgi:hypothetical protein
MARRVLESLDYVAMEAVVMPQTIGRSLLMKPEAGRRGRDRSYHASEAFWRDVLSERVGAERLVTLNQMRLFEWFPRNPGLFHTEQAEWARREAENHIRHIDPQTFSAYIALTDTFPDHAAPIRSVTWNARTTRGQIFTPRGKLSMLQGGIGCVRLRPAILNDSSRAWFMSATSSVSPDEGVPLLVPDDIFQNYIDRIREKGYATVSIRGRTRFIPERFTDICAARNGIPRLYVEVEEIEDGGPDEDFGLVSVAASFVAELEGKTSIYAAYVTFDPGHSGARANAARWLREEYVQGYYKGKLLTDFDQQAPTISNTLFSLDEVLTSPDLASAIKRLHNLRGHFDWAMLKESTINFTDNREYVRMKVQASNNSGNLVIGGEGSNNQIIVNNADLTRLTQDLARLIERVRVEPPSDVRDRAVGALLEAKEAAGEGDGPTTSFALKRLKPFELLPV